MKVISQEAIATMRLCALVFLLAAPALARDPAVVPAADWDVVVKPIGRDQQRGSQSFWVGLHNGARVPRAFCGLGVAYIYDLPDGSKHEVPVDEHAFYFSAHSCAETEGHLLLSHHTHFVRIDVPTSVLQTMTGRLRFRILAEQSCSGHQPCTHAFIVTAEAPAPVAP